MQNEVVHLNRQGKQVPCDLRLKVSDRELLQAESQWSPVRLNIQMRLLELSVPGYQQIEHGHWDWARKLRFSLARQAQVGEDDFRSIGIQHEEAWQGLSMVEASIATNAFSAMQKAPLVYVYFIETAPWNLYIPALEQLPEFAGTGTALLATCSRFSFIKGLEGRVGLHSLPQAESFYERVGFQKLGNDEMHEGLCYMELSSDNSLSLLRRVYGSRAG